MLLLKKFSLNEPRRREGREGREEKEKYVDEVGCAMRTLLLTFKLLTSRLVRGNLAKLDRF
jgi:hypothetical protein